MNRLASIDSTVSDAVIGEARERQRRRRLLVTSIVFTAALVGLAVSRSGQPGGGSVPAVKSGSAGTPIIPSAAALDLTPRQAITVDSTVETWKGHTVIGLGLANVSPSPATVLVSLKGHLPLTRSEVRLNRRLNPGEGFRNGIVTLPLPPNHRPLLWNLALILPRGSSGSVEIDLQKDFGRDGTPSSEIAQIGFHP
jgi:hypothetical protein